MTKVNHVMSTIDKCVDQEKKSKILNLIGIKKPRRDADFVRDMRDYLSRVS